MNPFVNFKKRSILLPAGCKDLADVLQPHCKRRTVADVVIQNAWEAMKTIQPGRFEQGGLAHVREYVGRIISSQSSQGLHIRSLNGLLGVSLYRSATEFSMIPIPDVAARTGRIEDFFKKRGIQPNFDQAIGTTDVPGGVTRILAYPLSMDVLAAAQLTVELLREVYDVDDATGLEFTTLDIRAA